MVIEKHKAIACSQDLHQAPHSAFNCTPVAAVAASAPSARPVKHHILFSILNLSNEENINGF